MCRIRNIRSGKVIEFSLRSREDDCLSEVLSHRGFEYDVPSRSFLMSDREFVRWIARGDRFARVLDAYAVADGSVRFATELVAGLCSGSTDGLLVELEGVLGLV